MAQPAAAVAREIAYRANRALDKTVGQTERRAFKREFFTTSARFSVTKLPSGNWLMVRYDCPDKDVRKNLTAYISTDEGRNWSGGLLLDDREKISYPDAFVHPDGRIFVQYDHLRQNGSLVMAVFREEDALAGKNVSGQVRLKLETLR